jgi:hypothetical protein
MTKTDTLATKLADWVAQLEFGRISGAAVDAAKLLILDQAGLQINGAVLPNVQPELQYARRLHEPRAVGRPRRRGVGAGAAPGLGEHDVHSRSRGQQFDPSRGHDR